MKIIRVYTTFSFFILLLFSKVTFGQGKIVINEFMSWSGCNTTSEFVELLNFGPGPMNIGCYILTNGKYSVTVPPNTIIQPRQYFVLSGQNILSQSCGNVDSAVHVDLNWTTCNCTNTPIPTTGDGFLQNGGNANEKVVLLDPNLNVIDAITRNIPVSSSVPITTPALSGGCSSKTFDLSTMNISYESVNSSTGIDNSFARKVDGDCGWVKTTNISARAPNKTGSTSSATYDFSTLSASQCTGTTGSISIGVSASDVNSLFPMNYTLGFDADSNNTFDNNDVYTYGTDNTPSTIDINNLPYGRYRITVASSSSCNLKSYDFYIFNCYGVVLPVKLLYFKYAGINADLHVFKFKVDEASTVKYIVLEGSDGGDYQPVATSYGPFTNNELIIKAALSNYNKFRLRLVGQSDVVSYSPEIKISDPINTAVRYWPNPVKEKVFIQVNALIKGSLDYSIINSTGSVVKTKLIEVSQGTQVVSIPTENLNSGMYYVKINGACIAQPISLRFMK